MKKIMLCMITVWMGVSTAFAEETLKLKAEAFQEIVSTDEKGKPQVKRIPAEKVVPGSEVLYVITYKNDGKKQADHVSIKNPLPKELTYIASLHDSAQAEFAVSVDQGKTYDTLERLKVKGEDGKPRPAKSSDVTDLRWSLKSSVPSGGSGSVSFKAMLK